jgi:hypothetical protein
VSRRFLPFVVVFVIYVTLGVMGRTFLLNWIIGPLFLLITLELIPRLFGRKPIFTLPPSAPTEERATP